MNEHFREKRNTYDLNGFLHNIVFNNRLRKTSGCFADQFFKTGNDRNYYSNVYDF